MLSKQNISPFQTYIIHKPLKIYLKKIAKNIDQHLTDSILRRCPDKTVGITFSGGVDSGYIAQKFRELDKDFICYNLAYSDHYNEYDRITQITSNLKLKVKKFIVTPQQLIENIYNTNSLNSEPIAFNDAALQLLWKAAKDDGINTMFEGGGADHLFLGMNSYQKVLKARRIFDLLKSIKLQKLTILCLSLLSHHELRKLTINYKNWESGLPTYIKRIYSHTNYKSDFENQVYELGVARFWSEFTSTFNSHDPRLFFTYQTINMDPEEHFYTPSEQQLALGLFPVSPYWSEELVSLALSIPPDLKLKNGKTKYILRKAAAINSAEKYWELPKIGLDNSFNYICNSKEGKDWQNSLHKSIMNSEVYAILKTQLSVNSLDLNLLIPLSIWIDAHLDS
ncbi:MAG: asparagine synthase C-terminal domain-containing protein [Calditrichia bacterium]